MTPDRLNRISPMTRLMKGFLRKPMLPSPSHIPAQKRSVPKIPKMYQKYLFASSKSTILHSPKTLSVIGYFCQSMYRNKDFLFLFWRYNHQCLFFYFLDPSGRDNNIFFH